MAFEVFFLPGAGVTYCTWDIFFVRFIPDYAALLSIVWVITISVIYVKYNKWY
jgi:hypothetical protein